MNNDKNPIPIAVVGVSTLFPGSVDSTGFWRDILNGSDLITEVPPSHWLVEDYYDPDPAAPDKTYSNRGAFLPKVEFDPMAWGVPPSTVPATDTCQLLALIVAQRVLDDAARGQFDYSDRERMSVILGVTSAQELLGAMVSRLQRPVWTKALREMGLGENEVQEACRRIEDHYTPWQESTFPGVLGNVVAGRIANRLNLGGTNCVSDAACASTFSALTMAVNELRLGQSDVVLCGGADTMNDIFMYLCFSKTPALSKTGDCRPFSDQADGTMLGEGFGMVALKRLEDAERDGDRVYAVIRAVGSSSDGKGTAVYAPVPKGQAKAIRRTYADLDYGPDTVELVEAHGTGTIAGDAAEFEGLRMVFTESGRTDTQWCALGSVKSQIGHAKAAAGAAGLVKAIFALHHKVLPPTIKVERPNPKLALESSPFHLNTRARPWIRDAAHPRRASVSSFGFGGSNFHVALEEYTGAADAAHRRRAVPTELVVLTAGSPDELSGECRKLAADALREGMLAYLARTSQQSYRPNAELRLGIVAKSELDLKTKLERAAELVASGKPLSTPDGITLGVGAPEGQVGFLFPGQGSQYRDMGADLAMAWDEARAPWDEAASAEPSDKERLHDVVFPKSVFSPEDEQRQNETLTATQWAQPAIGVASSSMLALLQAIGVRPAAVGGHSFGEIMALHAAGAISRKDAIRVARRRGELMAEAASTPGAMTAVSADADRIEQLLAQWQRASAKAEVVIANHNAPDQVVLSGPTEAIEAIETELGKAKLQFRRLPVATAFHSDVVSASTVPFATWLENVEMSAPAIDVFGNTLAAPYPKEAPAIRELVAQQIAKPVRFVDQVRAMYAAGVRTFVEVGPGSVLTGLVSRILTEPHRAIPLDRKGKHGVTSFHNALGQLVAAGVEMDLAKLWSAFAELEDPRTTKKPKLTVELNGANYGKPYPPPNGADGLPKPNPKRIATAPTPPALLQDPTTGQAPAAAAPVIPRATPAPLSASAPPEVSPAPIARAAVAAPSLAQTPSTAPPAASDAWASAYLEVQRQAIEAHATFTRAMSDAHTAFLHAQQSALQTLPAMLSGSPLSAQPPALLTAAPSAWEPIAVAAAHATPLATPAPTSAAIAMGTPVTASNPTPAVAPAVPPPSSAASVDLQSLMLRVVAEKTGYPESMLEPSLDLEGDLGVDSIKRVEILAAMRELAPGLPEVDPSELGKLRTLAEIVERMHRAMPAAATPAPSTPAASSVDLQSLMLRVVAEKTGYPEGMLEPSLDLEGDLGVDSIKRVEILAAMRELAPGLPEVDPSELGKLRTLAEIVERMNRAMPMAPRAPMAASAPAAPAASSLDLQTLMLRVVAEKTGYPESMLELSLDLEGDLGVDSIKRVEILAAMRELAPGLPEVDPSELGKLRTLGEIVDRMKQASNGTPAPVEPTHSSARRARAARWTLALEDVAATGFALRGLLDVTDLAIVDGGAGIATALAEGLSARGIPATAKTPDESSDGAIFLGGLVRDASRDAAREVQREAFLTAKALAPRLTEHGGVFVTVQDTGGDFGLSGSDRGWLSGLPGLVKTASQEWPLAGLRAIDIERAERDDGAIVEALIEELLTGGSTALPGAAGGGIEVALTANGQRRTLVSSASDVVPGTQRVNASSVIIASGGARGVTATTLIALARATGCRLVLLGRTPLTEEPVACVNATTDAEIKRALLETAQAAGEKVDPKALGAHAERILSGREVRATLAAIESAGGRARYVATDVLDAEALERELGEVRREWGPITGVVHGAGVLADRLIADKTLEQFDRVFDTKVVGLATLLDVTARDPLELLVTFSSVAGRCGNRGQCDYAMANETLNKVASLEARRRGLFARSFGWGPWDGGMVTPALKQHFEKLGVPLIELETGARMLVDELSGSNDDVELVVGGEPRPEALAAASSTSSISHRFDLLVDRTSFPSIDEHRVKGEPVLPVAMVLELFARAISAARPDLVFHSIEDVKVLRGVVLQSYESGGDRLTLSLRQLSNGDGVTFAMELLDRDGKVRYRATGQGRRAGASNGSLPPPATPKDLQRFERAVYDGVPLFHGDAFQVIVDAPQVGESGLEARLVGASARGWVNGARFETDPALVDGGLQLALLWTCHGSGGSALPTAVGSFRRLVRGFAEGEVRAVLNGTVLRRDRSVCDVVFLSADGVPIAELRGVEVHVLPDSHPGAPLHA